jgi:hypothetical protein
MNNGQKGEEALKQTAGKVPDKLQGFLNEGSFDRLFTYQEMVSAIRMLVDAGDNLRDLLMRADFPSKKKDSHRYILAAMRHRAKCREFHDTNAEDELMDVVAGFTSADGKRIEGLIAAITGAKPQKTSEGFAEKLKKAAGLEQ